VRGKDGAIFVFGSNLAGIHGAGSAKEAHVNWGAEWGVGVGRTGRAYAIPTKPAPYKESLAVEMIAKHVMDFLAYARAHPELEFHCVRIGCGRAGYTDRQMAPLFKGAPSNVKLPFEFKSVLEKASTAIG
jgi:hypothetical protein